MREVDAGVDHTDYHSSARHSPNQRTCSVMRLVGKHMPARRVLIGRYASRQLEPRYAGISRQLFERRMEQTYGCDRSRE